jgi:hypothetical protein
MDCSRKRRLVVKVSQRTLHLLQTRAALTGLSNSRLAETPLERITRGYRYDAVLDERDLRLLPFLRIAVPSTCRSSSTGDMMVNTRPAPEIRRGSGRRGSDLRLGSVAGRAPKGPALFSMNAPTLNFHSMTHRI